MGDINQDGNDDVVILDLLNDISNQRVVTYMGPIGTSTAPMVTALGTANANSYRSLEIGDWGESQQGLTGQCYDEDIWLLRSEGVDYATGQTTNPGNDDNVTVIEFNCQTNLFPATYTFSTSTQAGSHVVNMANTFGALDIGDMDNDGTKIGRAHV